MKRQRPLPAKKKGSEGGSAAPARLLAVANEILSQLETAVKRQDASTITALVGSTGNLTPALNAVTRIIKMFEGEVEDEAEPPDSPTSKDEFAPTKGDCDAMARYCLKRLAFLKHGVIDLGQLDKDTASWMEMTAHLR